MYEICVANGIVSDWQEFRGKINKGFSTDEWIGLTGSVIKLMFIKDIVAGDEYIPGMGTNTQLTVMGTIRNINPYTAIDYELWVIPVYEGIATFNGSSTILSTTVIPSREIVQTAPISAHDFTSNERAMGKALVEGGNFFDIIKSVATPLINSIPVVGPLVSGIANRLFSQPAPVAPTVALPAAPALRRLTPRRIRPGHASAGPVRRRLGRSVMGHALEGGALASPAQLGAVSRMY